MNDAIRELLSAYLDGALPELERRDVEERLSRSEELRAELESLRSVSNAVKGLPRAKLPAGFLARLESRRLRERAPSREYFILPPAYRPVAFALSSAIVAMVVWDKSRGPVGPAETARTAWDGAERVPSTASRSSPRPRLRRRWTSAGGWRRARTSRGSSPRRRTSPTSPPASAGARPLPASRSRSRRSRPAPPCAETPADSARAPPARPPRPPPRFRTLPRPSRRPRGPFKPAPRRSARR
ncbi:MAG: zf-HC2 domain-containing protein [Elusimicrobiota bacterium]|nr:MAG: zf-HC2 domain-containing protein [Elusimicrobiota bacterium]